MGKLLPIARGFTGLNNRDDPHRIKYDPETGIQDLAVAVNVDVDSTLRVGRRKGYVKKLTLPDGAHSVFCDGYDCIFVTDDALSVLQPDYTHAPIRNVTIGARMSCAQIGERTYYANGHERGYVAGGSSYPWLRNPALPVPPGYPPGSWQFYDPPTGHLLAAFNGAIFVAQGDTVWSSEPYFVEYFRLAKTGRRFSGRITMMRPVHDGLYVSDGNSTFFLQGQKGGAASVMEVRRIMSYPAIFGTDVVADGGRIGNGSMPGPVIMWTSPRGICVGGPGGQFQNLTEKRLAIPSSIEGCAFYSDGKYVVSLFP